MSKFLDNTGTLYLITKVKTLLSGKVDVVDGKGLSTNDFTKSYKDKLDGIDSGANKITVDAALSSTSTNPVQNKVVNEALSKKVNSESGKGLSTNDFTTTLLTKLNGIAEGANNTTVDSTLNSTSSNPIANKAVNSALGNKANLTSPSFSGTPTVPTAAAGTNTTQAASTAFVKTAVANAIAGVKTIQFKIVTQLPTTGEGNIIYLLANGGAGKNVYDEYAWIADSSTFEKFGSTDVDLSGYMKTSDMAAITSSEIDAMFAS